MLMLMRYRAMSSATRSYPSFGRRMLSVRAGQESSVVGRYTSLLRKLPLTTKCFTSACIAACGDAFTQLVIEDAPSIDLFRLRNFGLLGGIVIGPTLHVWYGSLVVMLPGATWAATGRRVLADQLLFSPIFIAVLFGALAVFDGRVDRLPDQLRQDWLQTVMTNWCFWGPVQVLNFGLVPLPYQVLFANVAAIVWNSYLSYVVNSR